MMHPNEQKQQFSIAYVRAIAAVAGCDTVHYGVDDDSVDMGLRAVGLVGRLWRSPQMNIQLKCTAQDVIHPHDIRFPLTRKNYDELLHTRSHVPKILIVVVVPEKIGDWVVQSEEALALKHCGYWFSLRTLGPTDNQFKVTLRIPRKQVFSSQTLKEIMQAIADGREP